LQAISVVSANDIWARADAVRKIVATGENITPTAKRENNKRRNNDGK